MDRKASRRTDDLIASLLDAEKDFYLNLEERRLLEVAPVLNQLAKNRHEKGMNISEKDAQKNSDSTWIIVLQIVQEPGDLVIT